MAFLDNSGDIILDAVLTDAGRRRLARGDGSFKIAKFALGDEEIDYSIYDATASDGSEDLKIMQSPILEAMTNSSSSMKSKLITIPRKDLLFLPIIKLNDSEGVEMVSSAILCAVTTDAVTGGTEPNYLSGYDTGDGKYIRLDQGIDNADSSVGPSDNLSPNLVETQYIVELDNRLGGLYSVSGASAKASFNSDDNITSYYFSKQSNVSRTSARGGTSTATYVYDNGVTETGVQSQVIAGSRGTYLIFKIGASQELRTSDYLFDTIGSTTTVGGISVKYIDTNLRVTGATTGYQVDLPIRFIKN